MPTIHRREFVKGVAVLSGIAAFQSSANGSTSSPQKGILISMLPEKLSLLERFKLAADLGFKGIEMQTLNDPKLAEEAREASVKSSLRIHSVMNMDHWKYPLSSSNPDEVKRSVQGMATSLHNAKLWGADTVLLVPAVVNAKTSYQDAYTRSQKVIREQILPLAQELRVAIGIEEVWNKFLLSPLEFARYVDEFQSPWVKAYFDVGNIVFYGYPQDWIRTLGKRIVKLHLKDFAMDRKDGQFYWRNLGEGDIE
jgi:hexulose-6-phosphate isomerase